MRVGFAGKTRSGRVKPVLLNCTSNLQSCDKPEQALIAQKSIWKAYLHKSRKLCVEL